ncbi:MAG TPA: alpha/beta fold hydrolase [Streptosporangiaceae bacterium]|nr:alpha/beta fold hydrolase [Streptosporangiaceae bacterium]
MAEGFTARMHQPAGGDRPAPRSLWADIDGPLHYLDYGGPADGPVFVCLHGLNGSGSTWSPIVPALTRMGRVLAIDLVGFGESEPRGRLRQVAGRPAMLDTTALAELQVLSHVAGSREDHPAGAEPVTARADHR